MSESKEMWVKAHNGGEHFKRTEASPTAKSSFSPPPAALVLLLDGLWLDGLLRITSISSQSEYCFRCPAAIKNLEFGRDWDEQPNLVTFIHSHLPSAHIAIPQWQTQTGEDFEMSNDATISGQSGAVQQAPHASHHCNCKFSSSRFLKCKKEQV